MTNETIPRILANFFQLSVKANLSDNTHHTKFKKGIKGNNNILFKKPIFVSQKVNKLGNGIDTSTNISHVVATAKTKEINLNMLFMKIY